MTRFDAICGVETKRTNIDELLLKLLGRLGLSSTSDAPNDQSAVPSGQATILPYAFVVGTLHDPASAAWNMDTVRQFVHDNNCTVEFDAFGFSVKDFMTRRVLLRCDSKGDLYPVTHPSPIPHAFLVSRHTWHQRLGYPGDEVLCRLVSSIFISCNKEKPLVFCHAFQLGKHVYPLVNKSDVMSKFVLFRNYVRTQFKCEIKSFQCDHGGEFDNRRLDTIFAQNGIQF
ncbi:ribonuclease H-like domain-containing protein [Tanacetum coccineum]